MSSALGDKKGRVADSSDLTRMRREAAAIGAHASYVAAGNIKKIAAQSGTTSGILAVKTSATTTVNAATTSVSTNPIAKVIVAAPTLKTVKKH
jgi:hypothetical protein